MVGIPIASHFRSALFTNEALDLALEFFRLHLWRYGDSNPRPLPCHGSALPAELYPQFSMFLPDACPPLAETNNPYAYL